MNYTLEDYKDYDYQSYCVDLYYISNKLSILGSYRYYKGYIYDNYDEELEEEYKV